MRTNKWLKSTLRFLRYVFLLFFMVFLMADWIHPIHPEISYSSMVYSAEDRPLAAFLSSDDKWRLYLEPEDISSTISDAFLLKEDRWFYFHPGFNPIAILRAFVKNIRGGKRVSGASTITMQVVRLLEPRKRTYTNKLIELFRALQLEWHYSKDEILRMYLNLVPYGGNIEGIKSASFLYFQCLPNQLSPAQIATLAIVPNRPGTWQLKPGNQALLSARNTWLDYFYDNNWLSQNSWESAKNEELNIERKSWKSVAPHLCRRLYSERNQPIIRSCIRYDFQRKSEALVHQYIDRLKSVQITNASVLIIDNKTRQVITYIGSADFEDKLNQGEVDGIRGIRSPGSTLKPLLYALSMEKGLITPKTIVYDVPSYFSGYSPENYDLGYHGAITVEGALTRSLNIPAVRTLQQYGVKEFVQKLKGLNMRQIDSDEKNLGLSMILGGCGVRLEELSNAYACLANQGEYRNLRYVKEDSGHLHYQWIKPEASYLVSEIMSKIERPDLPSDWQLGKTLPHIAWKTGTSYGRRDAWSIGFNDEYTIGVWVGNFDNQGVPGLSGAEMATPLLFYLFQSIQPRSKANWLAIPEHLSLREICTESGQIPGKYCINLGHDYFIPGISLHIPCQCRKSIEVNKNATMSYCRRCSPGNSTKEVVYRIYDPGLIRYFEDNHYSYVRIPPHNPDCPRIFQEEGPRIISPTDQAEYLIEKEETAQLSLVAETESRVREIYWYLNDRYMGSAKNGEDFIVKVPNGEVKISCTDDQGRTSHIRIKIKRF
ncbi:MAG: penicillin-binding protein 1C [Bacteroidetes bacterium]|nr:penicillin-binding protein 1C [Bacteroidota bacterium]